MSTIQKHKNYYTINEIAELIKEDLKEKGVDISSVMITRVDVANQSIELGPGSTLTIFFD